MKMHGSRIRGAAIALAATLFCAPLGTAQATGGNAPLPTPTAGTDATKQAPAAGTNQDERDANKFTRFVRAGANGAKVRNIYDAQGVVIGELPAQTVLAVHTERAGWLEVEAPGGFAVWVYGEYVVPTADAGVLQISANDVRMRPLPSPGAESLPLKQLLAKGQKVRLIDRKDVSKPLAQDWVSIWAPPGTRGWVALAETVALPAGTNGASLWAQAVTDARIERQSTAGGTKPIAAADVARNDNAAVNDALAKAERTLSEERAKQEVGKTPDYLAAQQAYEHVLTLAPSESTAKLVADRVELCKAYADGLALTRELEQQKATIDAALKNRQAEMERAARRGPFEGRFVARGWLQRKTVPGETLPVFVVRFGGEDLAEICCTSGRFDLSDFMDCEIGFNGNSVRGAVRGVDASMSRPEAFDLTGLEVLSSRVGR